MQATQKRMSISMECNENLAQQGQARKTKTMGVRTVLSRLLSVLSRYCPPALLYRARRGENPYDFSRPQTQRNYLNMQINRWS